MLTIDRIAVFYEQIQALWDVSAQVDEGKIIALIGPNGAGKSTTINATTGIVKINHGSVKLFDKAIHNLDPHLVVEEGICQIPEERLLFPNMTVLENLELGAFAKRARRMRNKNINQVYEVFPILSDRKKQLAGSLSGGEQQMLAIARGLMSRPKLLILDEPSFGLAPILVDEIFGIIKTINQQGVTILLVEQNIFQSLELAHYGYVLENGRVVLQGTGEELLQHPHIKQAYLGL